MESMETYEVTNDPFLAWGFFLVVLVVYSLYVWVLWRATK